FVLAESGRELVLQDRARLDRARHLHFQGRPRAQNHALHQAPQRRSKTHSLDLLKSGATHPRYQFNRYSALGYQDLFEAVQSTEAVLARPVNPNVMSLAEWRIKRAKKDSFAARIAAQPRLFVLGSDDDIG